MHNRNPRASYIGGFSVGCGVPRVEVIERRTHRIDGVPYQEPHYLCRITSRSVFPFTFGEPCICNGRDLYDRHHFIQGPKVVGIGKKWLKRFES
jgi:hypothetical protein